LNTTTINGGRYYVVDEIKNLALPSVTTILGADSPDKDFFIEWAKRVGPVKAVFGANRGTFMHALHEHYIDAIYIKQIAKPLQYAMINAKIDCPNFTEAEYVCGKNLFMQFLNSSDFYDRIDSVLFQEVPVWSFISGGYAGRLDLAIKAKDKKNKIVDFKSSTKPKDEIKIEDYKMQTAAYSIGMFTQYGIMPDETEIWISCESGDIQTFTLNKNQIKEYFEKFNEKVKRFHNSK